jgi:hypothetical protein
MSACNPAVLRTKAGGEEERISGGIMKKFKGYAGIK